jgi:hypothetical protein
MLEIFSFNEQHKRNKDINYGNGKEILLKKLYATYIYIYILNIAIGLKH